MEKANRNKLSKRFRRPLKDKRVVCIDIPDDYGYLNPKLIRLLETKVGPYLR